MQWSENGSRESSIKLPGLAVQRAPGIRGMFERTGSTRQLVVLDDADHFHFCDRVEEVHELYRRMAPPLDEVARRMPPASTLCPADHGSSFARTLPPAPPAATPRRRTPAP